MLVIPGLILLAGVLSLVAETLDARLRSFGGLVVILIALGGYLTLSIQEAGGDAEKKKRRSRSDKIEELDQVGSGSARATKAARTGRSRRRRRQAGFRRSLRITSNSPRDPRSSTRTLGPHGNLTQPWEVGFKAAGKDHDC